MKKYYPEGTFVYVNPRATQYAFQYVDLGSYLVTNKPPSPKQFVLHCPVAKFEPQPGMKIIEDIHLSPEDGPLAACYNAREQLREALDRGHGGEINAARMAVDKAELALRMFWEARANDDTKEDVAEAKA